MMVAESWMSDVALACGVSSQEVTANMTQTHKTNIYQHSSEACSEYSVILLKMKSFFAYQSDLISLPKKTGEEIESLQARRSDSIQSVLAAVHY